MIISSNEKLFYGMNANMSHAVVRGKCRSFKTSSYPGWIKSPHVVTLSILNISHLDSLAICIGGGVGVGGYSGVNFGHPKSEVFRIFLWGGIPE